MNFLLIPIGALCLALLPVPYDAYLMVRWIVFVFAFLAGYKLYKAEVRDIRWYGLIAVAIVFNPLFPFFLGRSLWMLVDIVAIGFLSFVAMRGADQTSGKTEQQSIVDDSARRALLTKAENAGDRMAKQVAITGLFALVVLLLITVALRR